MDHSRRLAPAAVSLLLLCAVYCTISVATGDRESRSIPLLVYPNGGAMKWVVGLSVPVKVSNRSVGMFLQLQGLYAYPANTSDISQHFPLHVGRSAVYAALTSIMDAIGMDGRSCLMRSICEAAETPLLHSGLLGELAHLLLTPSDGEPGVSEHVQAQEAGRGGGSGGGGGGSGGGGGGGGGSCRQRFPGCGGGSGGGLLHAVSTLARG